MEFSRIAEVDVEPVAHRLLQDFLDFHPLQLLILLVPLVLDRVSDDRGGASGCGTRWSTGIRIHRYIPEIGFLG